MAGLGLNTESTERQLALESSVAKRVVSCTRIVKWKNIGNRAITT
jgi:hypothetical protein